MDNVEYKAARAIVKHLENDLNMAKNRLPVEGHDDREALIVNLERTLAAARNVLRNIERRK